MSTQKSLPIPSFDALAFLARWKKPSDLSAFFAVYGVDVRTPAVVKWRERERIPSDKFALMLAFLEIEQGHPISLTPFIR